MTNRWKGDTQDMKKVQEKECDVCGKASKKRGDRRKTDNNQLDGGGQKVGNNLLTPSLNRKSQANKWRKKKGEGKEEKSKENQKPRTSLLLV